METQPEVTENENHVVSITTKTGDKGTSSLYNGKRFPKYDYHFEALGTLDECNSYIGLAREYLTEECSNVSQYLETIQCVIFDVNAAVATPLKSSSARVLNKTAFNSQNCRDLEKWSFILDKELPVQDSFLLPSGGKAACHIHCARCICRRAERIMSRLLEEEDIKPEVYEYVNRLSDFLYIAARYVTMKEGIEPKKWRKIV